jgi:N-acetylglutamate synthase
VEFIGGGRLEVRITPLDVGKRVSIRRLVEPSDSGEKFTDTVGVLTSWDKGVLLITRRTGESVRIPESALVAGKTVPPAPARRRGPAAGFGELARVTARAWRPVESEPLGEWELRAAVGPNAAGRPVGFTRRANSVLPLGDPGIPLKEAFSTVRAWYAERGLPALVQAATGAADTQEELCAALEADGWTREVSAVVRTGPLTPLADAAPAGSPAGEHRVAVARTPDGTGPGWLDRYRPGAPAGPHALRVLESGPSVWFAAVAGEGRVPVAVGRCVVDGRWAGFSAVETDPLHRRRGLATAVMAALARQALAEGASASWLQVETGNAPARVLYDGLGFTDHHLYHHYRA